MSKKVKSRSLPYLKFLNLVDALRAMPTFPKIDPIEERLLDLLAIAWSAGRQVTVLEAMRMSPDRSSATVHRLLKSMLKKGVIELRPDALDGRIKHVVPTTATNQYFAKLNQCMLKVAKS